MSKIKTILTTCPYCGVGCGVEITPQEQEEIFIKGDKTHPANFGQLCSKGSVLADTIGLEDRLLHPMIDGEPANWDTALTTVADKLTKIITEHGADAVAFYVSGQLLTEDYYVANKLMKGFIGSANIDTNSRLCMSSAVAGYKRAFGSDSVPCCYEDFEMSDLIVIVGSNTAWCHPVIFQRIVHAKKQRPELKIIVIDPRKTATCDIANLHLALKPGTDASLFNGLLTAIAAHDKLDQNFIEYHSEGWGETLQCARQTAPDIDQVARICKLEQQQVQEFFELFINTEKVVTLYSQGINQSSSGTDKSNAIINCHLATGRIGQPAMGPFSITGQPNAMGGREVGALSNQLAAHMELSNSSHHHKVSRFWQTENLASAPGLKAVDMFEAVAKGEIKAIWIIATNPVVTLPNADIVRKAIENCDLVIVSECELNTDTAARANILLPALAWGEKSGTVTNSERRISRQRSFLAHPGEAEEDWWILSEVAKRMGFCAAFNYQSSADIFREHARLSGFENNGERNFDISGLATITDQQYDDLLPIQWPVTINKPAGTQRLFEDKQFFTVTGKAQFIPIYPCLPKNTTSVEYPLILNTGRVRDQWHTMTRTARSVRLNAHIYEPIIQIHPDDANNFNLKNSALARVESQWGNMLARVVVTTEQQRGSLFVPMHWNEFSASKGRVNALVNPVVDPISGQPEFKHTPVTIKADIFLWYGFILSRTRLKIINCEYWVKINGLQFFRYELAAGKIIENPSDWAKNLLGNEGEWIEFIDKGTNRYRATRIVNNRLEAVFFMGPDVDLPARTWLSQLFSETVLTDEKRQGLLAGKPGAGLTDCGSMVCACFGVGENTIKDAVKDGSVNTVEALGDLLKVGTNCGSCIPELKQIISGQKV